MSKQQLSPFGMALTGAIGGVISNAVIYPLDTIKTRIQTEVTPPTTTTALPTPTPSIHRINAPKSLTVAKGTGVRKMLMRIIKEQGLAGLYRGFGASMLNSFSMQFAYFYWYTIIRRTYMKRFLPLTPTAPLNTLTELALGALSAAFAQLFTIPVSVIATRQQLADGVKGGLSFLETVREVVREDGVTGLWRGLKPSLVLTVNPAITYGMFERLKTVVLSPGEKMTPGKAFVTGALSKTMATVVTYPYIMAKTRLQAKYSSDPVEDSEGSEANAAAAAVVVKKEKYSGAIDCLSQVYREKGLGGWYQGMQAQITKAVLSQALLFGIKDALEAYVILAFVYYAKYGRGSIGIKQL